MRITFVTDSLGFGGAAKMILFVARGMMQRGHEVKMINLNCFNAFDRMPEDIETVSAHITYSGAIKTNYQVCKFVYDNAKRFKPDILVAFNSASNFSAAIAGRLLHLPVIVSERADPFLSHKNPQFSVKIKQWFVAHADGTVFQSEGASMIYPEKLRCRSTVIPNPITLTEHFAPIDYSKRPHTIVTHGRYDNKQKRYDVMLKGFSLFKQTHPDYKLIMYGTGSDESKIRDWVKELNLEDSVTINPITHTPMTDITREGIYAITSDFEGISNSLLEAMAVGMPVVCTDHSPGGGRLVVQDHQNGLLIPCGSPEAVANAFAEFADNPELAEQCGNNAKDVLVRFHPEKIMDMWESYINQVADRFYGKEK